MITYDRWIHVSCLYCGHNPLEICAFVYKENDIEKSTPVLVCPSHRGCGTFFSPDEYDLVDVDGVFKLDDNPRPKVPVVYKSNFKEQKPKKDRWRGMGITKGREYLRGVEHLLGGFYGFKWSEYYKAWIKK